MAEINTIKVNGEDNNIGLKLKLVESGTKTTNENAELIFNNELEENKFYFIVVNGDVSISGIYTTLDKSYKKLYDSMNDYELMIAFHTINIVFLNYEGSIFTDLANCEFNYQIYELPISL